MTDNKTFEFAPFSIGTMRLGKWGAKMSKKELEAFLEECLQLGLRDIDHADIYGDYTAEGDFGEVIKSRPDLKDRFRIITKCGIKMVTDNRPTHQLKSYDLGAEHIKLSVDNSLKALSVDSIDLLLLHRPDLLISPHEVAEVFEELRNSGKVKYFGVSNFTPSQFNLLNTFTPLITNQIEASITHLNPFLDGTLDQCTLHNIRPMIWSPFGGGGILGETEDPRLVRIKEKGKEIGDRHNASLDQILLAWLLKHPSKMVPVLGTTKVERVKSALASMEISLSKEEWYELLETSRGHEVA